MAKKVMRAKGIFKGKNGSCGYETGKEYRLILQHTKKDNIIVESPDVPHTRGQRTPHDQDGYCEYGSLLAFLSNWEGVSEISDKEYFSKPGIIYKNDPPLIRPWVPTDAC